MTEDNMASRWPGWKRLEDAAVEAGASGVEEVIAFARAQRLPVLHLAGNVQMVPADLAERLKQAITGAKS